MDLPPGTYRGVRCDHCDVKGSVTVKDDGTFTENHKHRSWCRYAPKQPEHFRRRRRRVQRQEAEIAAATEGRARLTFASGAYGPDNDARTVGGWRIEAKSTEKERWVVTPRFWTTLCERAQRNDEEPMLVVDFLQPRGVERMALVRRAAWDGDVRQPLPTVDELARTTYHLTPQPWEPRDVPGLKPPAVALPFEQWLTLFKDSR